MEKIGVVGAGSWGTTLAQILAEKGHKVTLWVYEEDLCKELQQKKENTLYLPGVKLSSAITPTNSIEEAVEGKKVLVNVVPSHVTRSIWTRCKRHVHPDARIMNASKGIETDSLLTISGILKDVLEEPFHTRVATLSGPSFAKEVSRKIPTTISVASPTREIAEYFQNLFTIPSYLRIYTTPDILGVELGGSLKNVIAIAAGCTDGQGLGLNTRAALITRGLSEISRLALKMGAKPLTLSGLAGMGDLILTCTGELSRNRTLVKKIGQGMTLGDILSEMKMVAEGVNTTKSAHQLAEKYGIEMPITNQVYLVLYQNKSPQDAVVELMSRVPKYEHYDLDEGWE